MEHKKRERGGDKNDTKTDATSGPGTTKNSSEGEAGKKPRKKYASLDVNSMGVDVNKGPVTNLDNKLLEEASEAETEVSKTTAETPTSKTKSRTIEEAGEIESEKLVESITEKDLKQSQAPLVPSVVKRRPKKSQRGDTALPPGWEKHSDDNGFYYWHIKSGTIQREPPEWDEESEAKSRSAVVRDVRSSNIFDEDFDPLLAANPKANPSTNAPATTQPSAEPEPTSGYMSKSCTSSSIIDLAKERDLEQKRRSLPPSKTDSLDDGGPTSTSGVKPMKVCL